MSALKDLLKDLCLVKTDDWSYRVLASTTEMAITQALVWAHYLEDVERNTEPFEVQVTSYGCEPVASWVRMQDGVPVRCDTYTVNLSGADFASSGHEITATEAKIAAGKVLERVVSLAKLEELGLGFNKPATIYAQVFSSAGRECGAFRFRIDATYRES